MPSDRLGQLISFEIVAVGIASWKQQNVRRGDTVQKIATRLKHAGAARMIADRNGIRNVRSKLGRKKIWVPVWETETGRIDVLAGDRAPRITDGYAKFDTTDRPLRTGLTTFTGYNPITMEVPIRFEAFKAGEGKDIEADIRVLERMAGRGIFKGAAVGGPPVIRVSTTDNSGEPVPLIPRNYQAGPKNPNPPLWRIAGIDWDEDALRNSSGNRVRQYATVTLIQDVRTGELDRVAADNSSRGVGGAWTIWGRRGFLWGG